MARLDAQASQIHQYQEMETNSCIEKSDLREELKQARVKIKDLEAKVALTAYEEPPGSSAKNIVPFSAIENELPPARDASPYDDPAEFAMLLESEGPVPSPQVKASSNEFERTASATSKQKEPSAAHRKDSSIDKPENLDQFEFTRKRKAVNFEATHPEGPVTDAEGPPQESGQGSRGQEERPTKTSRHVHKWTYSRIRTTPTEIQKEQSTGPGAPAINHRRPSPKSLVSASSASHAAGRPNTRSRGRRRSRGMTLDLGFDLSEVHLLTSGRRALQCPFQPGGLIPRTRDGNNRYIRAIFIETAVDFSGEMWS